MNAVQLTIKYQCWHCRSTQHQTRDCPDRYRGGALDGTYDEWKAKRLERAKVKEK